jgi:hypothetical protein
MRQTLILLIAALAFSFTIDAQLVRVNGYEQILSPKEAEDVPAELQGIQFKKYLTQDYKPAFVDSFTERAFLRYNIYEDQMEFVKDDNIYYLKKDLDRTVRFVNNTKYTVKELNGEAHFFLVHQDGKNQLLAYQTVRFVEAREPETGYDVRKPADFKRRKDELFLSLDGKGLVSVPKKKKTFYPIFGDKASEIKSYVKKNKLGYKRVKDLKKIVAYYNTL